MKFSFYLSDIEGIFFAAVRLFRILFFFFFFFARTIHVFVDLSVRQYRGPTLRDCLFRNRLIVRGYALLRLYRIDVDGMA